MTSSAATLNPQPPIRVEIAKAEVYPPLSDETVAFHAALVIGDDRHIVHVSNDGKGGCNDYAALTSEARRHLTDLETWAKTQTLPFSFEHLDQIVNGWVDAHLDAQDAAKARKSGKRVIR